MPWHVDHAWTTPDHCLSFEATPHYKGDSLVPYRIEIKAHDECTGEVIVNWSIDNRLLH
jgi:hypothetical protein